MAKEPRGGAERRTASLVGRLVGGLCRIRKLELAKRPIGEHFHLPLELNLLQRVVQRTVQRAVRGRCGGGVEAVRRRCGGSAEAVRRLCGGGAEAIQRLRGGGAETVRRLCGAEAGRRGGGEARTSSSVSSPTIMHEESPSISTAHSRADRRRVESKVEKKARPKVVSPGRGRMGRG